MFEQSMTFIKKQKMNALAAALAIAISGCGGGATPITGVVAFGDSLTDGGTYANGIIGAAGGSGPGGTLLVKDVGGGKFLTNSATSKTWAEVVAANYSVALTPAANEGFSLGYVPLTGKNYAQGGSRVKLVHPTTSPTGASQAPVSQQLSRYLATNGGFSLAQLVLVNAGANDIFVNTDPAMMAVVPNPQPAIEQAAVDLAMLIAEMQSKGAVRIAVANLPNMGKTPAAVAGGPAAVGLLSGMSAAFNTKLKSKLDSLGVQYAWIDSYTWLGSALAGAAASGITNTTGMACAGSPPPNNVSSLLCAAGSPVNPLIPGADLSYAFADSVHPSTKMHQLYGAFALTAIRAAGW